MDGCKLFRREKTRRRGGGVALYVKKCVDCVEIDDEDDKVEHLWVKIRGKVNRADIVVVACYRSPNQDKQSDETPYKLVAEVSQSTALILMGKFSLLSDCWKYNTDNTAERNQRFLECVKDNFLT